MDIREINKVSLLGNLVMVPRYQDETETSQARTYFRMAINNESRKVDKPWYVDVISWDRLAKAVARWCAKGKQVLVDGSLETYPVTTKDGKNVLAFHVRADTIKFGRDSKKQREDNYQQPLSSSEQPRQSHSDPLDEDISAYMENPYEDNEETQEENSAGLKEIIQHFDKDDLLKAVMNLTEKTLKENTRF